MKREWREMRLADVTIATETAAPNKRPNVEFEYIDVSSVSNESFEITGSQKLLGRQAPSRARRRVRTDDVLFATIRPTLKRIAMIPAALQDAICSTGFIVLRTTADFLPRFLFYFLQTDGFVSSMEALQKGTSYPAVTDSDVRNQVVPVPPLPEQRRIVAILDEALKGIAAAKANAERNLRNAREVFESRLAGQFNNGGGSWPIAKLEDVCGFQGGSQPPKSQFRYQPAKGFVRFLQIRDFASDKNLTYIPASKKNRLCESEDIMLGRYGASVGKVLTGLAGAYNVALIKTIPDESRIAKRYLYHYLTSPAFQSPLRQVAARSAQDGFSREDIGGFQLALPPISEQAAVIERLDEVEMGCDRLGQQYIKGSERLDELKGSLLHQAFTGQL